MIAILLGGILGLVVALWIGIVAALVLGSVLPFLSVFGFLLPFLSGFTPASGLMTVFFAVFITTLFAYFLAVISLAPALAGVVGAPLPIPPAPIPVPFVPLEGFFRGFLIGLSAGLNFSIWAMLPLGPIALWVGLLLALVNFLAVFPPLAVNLAYQSILGWTSWLRPLSWLMTFFGLILFLLDLPSVVGAPAPAGIRVDGLTGTVEITGGALSGIRFFGSTSAGFNLGNFTFLAPAFGGTPTPLIGPGLSAHETGHTLTIAAFGGVFGWINAVDENLPPFANRALAYGELIPESHFPRNFAVHVLVWS
jgi:hypothetical protein